LQHFPNDDTHVLLLQLDVATSLPRHDMPIAGFASRTEQCRIEFLRGSFLIESIAETKSAKADCTLRNTETFLSQVLRRGSLLPSDA
jgi:hypothetical protein